MRKKIVKSISIPIAICTVALMAVGCKDKATSQSTQTTDSNIIINNNEVNVSTIPDSSLEYSDIKDFDSNAEAESDSTTIKLSGTNFDVAGSGVSISGNIATITAGGTYIISGALTDGGIIVDAADDDKIHIILDGVTITSSSTAPIYVNNADKVTITLSDGSVNSLSDSPALNEDDAIGAVIYSKKDLSINGTGTLNINGTYKNGIQCQDDLKIVDGIITVTAENNGIRGKDSLTIAGGTIDITCKGNGLSASNDKEGKGYINITGGSIKITCDKDGLDAENDIQISGGTFDIVTGGGYTNGATHSSGMGGWGFREPASSSDTESSKGIKSATGIYISGGVFTLDCSDDAIHTNGVVKITEGSFTISSGDDGVHADSSVEINGGTLKILHSYEGLEGQIITINNGVCDIVASDDGINAADGSSTGMQAQTNCTLTINGGIVKVNAAGDGVDSNNTITMNGGIVIVEGPTDSGNAALDFERAFTINGGYVIATGSSGMAESFASDSKQCAALITVNNAKTSERVTVAADDGTVIISTIPTKTWNALNVSSPAMSTGNTYHIYQGGELTGSTELYSGTYAGGTISGGTELTSYEQANTIYSMGGNGGFGGGFGGGGRPDGDFGGRPDGNMGGGKPDGGRH